MSPVSTNASGPPIADSGATCSTTVPKAVPLMRASEMRTMSGTAFGTVVLHVAPESAIGGPLAFVETGDMIILDTAARRLELDVPAEEIERRRKAFVPPPPAYERGYGKLYIDHVTQADKGVDFDFLTGKSGTPPSKLSF